MKAGKRHVGDVHHGILAALLPADVHPSVAIPGLTYGIGKKIVLDELVLVRQEAIVAVVAKRQIDDHVPGLHRPSPSHFSTSMRAELLAMAVEVGVMKRFGVSMLMHPLRSGEYPGSPRGR